jgi:hypothetical protein
MGFNLSELRIIRIKDYYLYDIIFIWNLYIVKKR